MEKLPIYKITINESDEDNTMVDYVALVESPAIERNWQAFNKKEFRFKADEKRKIISGPLMLADVPIYRRDDKLGEYYVVFDKDNIEKIVLKYFRNNFHTNVNLMHDHKKRADGVYMFSSIIIDKELGYDTPKGFEKLPEGSWFGSFKVDNNEIWDNFIETGVFKGFSVEGNFDLEFKKDPIQEIIDIINNIK